MLALIIITIISIALLFLGIIHAAISYDNEVLAFAALRTEYERYEGMDN